MTRPTCSRCGASGAHHLCEQAESVAEQIAELEQLDAKLTSEVLPHLADKIEPGAILYSSWGYDQTNIDYYMVTRTTKASAWIVPMRQRTQEAAFLSEWTTPLEPMATQHVWDRETGLRVERPVRPEMHRIKRYGDSESLTLTSYSGAYLWDGRSLYATHYA